MHICFGDMHIAISAPMDAANEWGGVICFWSFWCDVAGDVASGYRAYCSWNTSEYGRCECRYTAASCQPLRFFFWGFFLVVGKCVTSVFLARFFVEGGGGCGVGRCCILFTLSGVYVRDRECVCVCVGVCCTYLYVCVHTYIDVYIYKCIYIHIYIRIYIYPHKCMCILVCIYAHLYIYTYI